MAENKHAWRLDGACIGEDPELWTSYTNRHGHYDEKARRICNTCEVRDKCLETHIEETFGIFGGLDEKQRKMLLNNMQRRTAS